MGPNHEPYHPVPLRAAYVTNGPRGFEGLQSTRKRMVPAGSARLRLARIVRTAVGAVGVVWTVTATKTARFTRVTGEEDVVVRIDPAGMCTPGLLPATRR